MEKLLVLGLELDFLLKSMYFCFYSDDKPRFFSKQTEHSLDRTLRLNIKFT